MRYVNYAVYEGFINMALDADILEKAIEAGDDFPIFRLYGWSPKCISLGRNQNFDIADNLGINYVRRLTGGRALLHDDEITYSCVIPVSYIPGGESVSTSYRFISGLLVDFFKTLGVELEFGGEKEIDENTDCSNEAAAAEEEEKKETKKRHDYCMLVSTGADLCYKGKKLIGSAQYRKQGYILQHGSILFNYDKKLLEKLFKEKIPKNTICTVNEILPHLTKQDFVKEFEKFMLSGLAFKRKNIGDVIDN